MAKKIQHTSNVHQVNRVDDYAWLQNASDPDLIPTLEEENRKTEATLAHLQPLQEEIYKEIISRILENDDEFPYAMGSFTYFYRLEKGKNYPLYYRSERGGKNPKLILDLNEKAIGKKFLHMPSFRISPDEKKIAYALDFDGSEKYQLIVEDLASGKVIDDALIETSGDFEWADSESLYYTLLDSTHRPDRVIFHTIGTSIGLDVQLYQDNNLSFYVELSRSKSNRFAWITSRSKITTEVFFIDLTKDLQKITVIEPRKDNIKYTVDHHENRFIIVTNENAENYKLMQTSIESHQKQHWTPLIEYNPERSFEDLEIFKNHIVLAERFGGQQTFRVLNCSTDQIHDVQFHEPVYAISFDHNEIYDGNTLRFSYSSMKTPPRTQQLDLTTLAIVTLKEKIIPAYDPSQYTTERLLAPSQDGKTMVPISIIYKNNFQKNGKAALFLYGYGSYGMSRPSSFSPSIFSLLDRGFAYAIAHVRGGSECGRSWYHDGKFLKKKNTFNDFIDCAKFLIDQKYSSPKRIAICGGSAGGLLMGAVVNMQPQLWGAVVALVPFVDVVNTMMDETLPLTVTEYDEWGNPNDPTYFNYMLSYSPYDNIVAENFPPILATGGLHDPRVGYWEPTKWVFKLREHQKSNSPILLKIQMAAGHQGPSGRYEAYREVAYYYGFVIDQIKSAII